MLHSWASWLSIVFLIAVFCPVFAAKTSTAVDLSQLEYMISCGLTGTAIASTLGISKKVLNSLKKKHAIYTYHQLDDSFLMSLVVRSQDSRLPFDDELPLDYLTEVLPAFFLQAEACAELGPRRGISTIQGWLRTRTMPSYPYGFRLGEHQIRRMLKIVDPAAHALRCVAARVR